MGSRGERGGGGLVGQVPTDMEVSYSILDLIQCNSSHLFLYLGPGCLCSGSSSRHRLGLILESRGRRHIREDRPGGKAISWVACLGGGCRQAVLQKGLIPQNSMLPLDLWGVLILLPR